MTLYPPGRKNAGVVLFLILTVLPLGSGLIYALRYSIGWAGMQSAGFTLMHWSAVLTGGTFWQSLGFSFWIAVWSMGLSLLLALAAVISGTKKFRSGPLSWLIYLPLTLPAMVVAFFIFQMLSGGGFLSRLAFVSGLTEGIDGFPNLINDPWGIGIIVSHVCMATPFFILLFTQLYQSEQLERHVQLAATLGARPSQILRRVQVPVLLVRAFPTLILYFVFVMSSYEIPLLLGSQSPQMVSVLTIRKLQRFDLADIPQAYVISVLYTLFVVCMIWILLRNKSEKIPVA